jgi:hypothetical protein
MVAIVEQQLITSDEFKKRIVQLRYLDGVSYQLARFTDMQFTFEADVDTIDVKDMVRRAVDEIARRRARFRKM